MIIIVSGSGDTFSQPGLAPHEDDETGQSLLLKEPPRKKGKKKTRDKLRRRLPEVWQDEDAYT